MSPYYRLPTSRSATLYQEEERETFIYIDIYKYYIIPAIARGDKHIKNRLFDSKHDTEDNDCSQYFFYFSEEGPCRDFIDTKIPSSNHDDSSHAYTPEN